MSARAAGQVDGPQPAADAVKVTGGTGELRDRDSDALDHDRRLVADGLVQGVQQGVGGGAVPVADVQPGEVDERFECEPPGPGIEGTGTQVCPGVLAAPLPGLVSAAAAGGEQGGLVEDR